MPSSCCSKITEGRRCCTHAHLKMQVKRQFERREKSRPACDLLRLGQRQEQEQTAYRSANGTKPQKKKEQSRGCALHLSGQRLREKNAMDEECLCRCHCQTRQDLDLRMAVDAAPSPHNMQRQRSEESTDEKEQGMMMMNSRRNCC